MPDTAKPRTLITSALPYINGIKHLGNLVGSQLPADVYARFCRATGHEVMFICATDEHGTPAEIAAQNAGKMWRNTANRCTQSKRNWRIGLIYRSTISGGLPALKTTA